MRNPADTRRNKASDGMSFGATYPAPLSTEAGPPPSGKQYSLEAREEGCGGSVRDVMKTWKNPRPLRPKSTRPKSTRPDAVAPGSQDPRPSSPTLPQHRFRGEEVSRGHHAHAAQARGDAHFVRERAVYHASVGVL